MIKKDKALLIFLPSYQNNHESYYKVLTEVVFNEKNVTLLAYSNDCNLKSNNNLRVICPKKNEGINQFTLRNIKYFIKADLIVLEELYKVSFPGQFANWGSVWVGRRIVMLLLPVWKKELFS